ncbi:MAG: hypothetical protein DHS20C05_01060 [Hyphococcus sp.]|nr:MAG: hypothetical protein DHS20C05_01060 [Marinicaulis sp.]
MILENQFPAQFYDGKSAASQAATVGLEPDQLVIDIDGHREVWTYKHLTHIVGAGDGLRLTHRRNKDAILVLGSEAETALRAAAPEVFDGSRERRRMTGLVITMIAAAGIIGAGLFIGVPAASGPLAHSTPKDFEMRMGKNLSAQITTLMRTCSASTQAVAKLQPTLDELAETGDVGFPITFQFVHMSAPNAFALPGGQVMATSGLLELLKDDPDAFVGVLAHELGHVKARDGMQALYRNAGLGILLEVITGGSGIAQQLVLVGGQIRQLRYNRRQESLADETAAEIMLKANMDPGALARAFEALQSYGGKDDTRDHKIPGWLSSHPDTQKRIERARERAVADGVSPIDDAAWAVIVEACSKKSEEE